MPDVRPTGVVGFVGLGRMGSPMVLRLHQAGFDVLGFDTNRAAADALHATAPALAIATSLDEMSASGVLILMLPDSSVVQAVLVGGGLLELLAPGSVVLDMSSSEPTATRDLAERAARHGVRFVDAPVSGGVSGARTGQLTIMAGGSADDLDSVHAVLDVLGSRTLHVGPVGAGHATKALNNLLSAAHLLATSEAMVVARKFGLDVATVLDAVNQSSGRSGSTENKWPNFVLPETYDSGFGLRLMLKDMRIATELARSTGTSARFGDQAVRQWAQAAASLPDDADHTEIARWVASGQAPLEADAGNEESP